MITLDELEEEMEQVREEQEVVAGDHNTKEEVDTDGYGTVFTPIARPGEGRITNIDYEEEEEWNEGVDVAQAVAKARKAFHKHFEDQNLESAFWRLKLVVERLDFEFKEVLNRTTFEEVG